jgi:hypothetical protein
METIYLAVERVFDDTVKQVNSTQFGLQVT